MRGSQDGAIRAGPQDGRAGVDTGRAAGRPSWGRYGPGRRTAGLGSIRAGPQDGRAGVDTGRAAGRPGWGRYGPGWAVLTVNSPYRLGWGAARWRYGGEGGKTASCSRVRGGRRRHDRRNQEVYGGGWGGCTDEGGRG